MTVTILWRGDSDGTGTKIVRAYENKDRAEEDMEILKDDLVYKWNLTEVPLFE